MAIQSIDDLLLHEVQDLYSAETQIIEALPKMINVANDELLKKGFEDHLTETEKQRERLEEIADMIDIEVAGHTCRGMEGLLKEGEEVMKEEPSEILDQALIGVAQRVEHYEIAGYGCAVTYSQLLGKNDVAELLKKTLNEEEKTDKKLTEIAQKEIKKVM